MLRFLLDEHISPAVGVIVRERRSSITIHSVSDWPTGSLRGRDDDAVLTAAANAGFTLVTYDLRTIPNLLRQWSAEGRSHGGVIFIDERTYPPRDVVGISQALTYLWDRMADFDWRDRAAFAIKPRV